MSHKTTFAAIMLVAAALFIGSCALTGPAGAVTPRCPEGISRLSIQSHDCKNFKHMSHKWKKHHPYSQKRCGR